jgi:hypothetical protein
MSPLRDLLVTPRTGEAMPDDAPPARRRGLEDRPQARRRAPLAASAGAAPSLSLGLLAPAGELPAVAAGAGLVLARAAPAALVCVCAPGARVAAPALRAPARVAAARLAASLRARDLDASARGRLAVVALPDDPAARAGAAARALAAAGTLPTVLATVARDVDVDVLLGACDALLVALPATAEPALARLALTGAAELVPRAAALAQGLDPVQRALALAGVRAPGVIRRAVEGLLP